MFSIEFKKLMKKIIKPLKILKLLIQFQTIR